jgi:hypothetical protein
MGSCPLRPPSTASHLLTTTRSFGPLRLGSTSALSCTSRIVDQIAPIPALIRRPQARHEITRSATHFRRGSSLNTCSRPSPSSAIALKD